MPDVTFFLFWFGLDFWGDLFCLFHHCSLILSCFKKHGPCWKASALGCIRGVPGKMVGGFNSVIKEMSVHLNQDISVSLESAAASRNSLDSVLWLAVLCFSLPEPSWGSYWQCFENQALVWRPSTLSRLYYSSWFLLFCITSFLFSMRFLIPIPILPKLCIINVQFKTFVFSEPLQCNCIEAPREQNILFNINQKIILLEVNHCNTYH